MSDPDLPFPDSDQPDVFHPLAKSAFYSRVDELYSTSNMVVSRVAVLAQKKTILIADDEALSVELLNEFLLEEEENYELINACSGDEAYDLAVACLPDLIIADWLMPGMNGIELIEKLKAEPATRFIPVIMATGVMTSVEDLQKVFAAGAIDYMEKPIDRVQLNVRVKAALTLAESQKEMRQQKEKMQVNTQFVNFLADAVPNPIFYQDKWGHFLGCNKSFETLVNKSRSEIIGKMADDFLPWNVACSLDEHFSLLREIPEVKFEVEMPDEEEGCKQVEVSYSVFDTASRENLVVVIGSITEVNR